MNIDRQTLIRLIISIIQQLTDKNLEIIYAVAYNLFVK